MAVTVRKAALPPPSRAKVAIAAASTRRVKILMDARVKCEETETPRLTRLRYRPNAVPFDGAAQSVVPRFPSCTDMSTRPSE